MHLVWSWRLLVWLGSLIDWFEHEVSELSEILDGRQKNIQYFFRIELLHMHLVVSRILIVWSVSLIYGFNMNFQ